MNYNEFMDIIREKAENYKIGRHFALVVKPLSINDVEEAYLSAAEYAFRLLEEETNHE